MICSVHHGPIRGKVYRWNNRSMCKRCYSYFCGHVHLVRKPSQDRGSGLSRLLLRLLRG